MAFPIPHSLEASTAMNIRIGTLLPVSLAVCGVLAGCSGSTGPDGEEFTERTTPQRAVDRLVEGYDARSATIYLSCLSEDCLFYLEPNTVAGDPALPGSWGKPTERMLHEEAFGRRSGVGSMSLTLTQVRDPLEIPGPNPEDPSQWEYYEQYSLDVTVDGVEYEVNGYASLTLATHEGDTTAQGDARWSVVEWHDTGDVPCRPNITNWTEVKLLFGENSSSYPLRTSGAGVIEKLRQSYVAMDAIAFTDCLADTFRFWLHPSDVNNPGGLPEYWELDTESTVAWNMFGPGGNVESTQLTFTQIGTPTEIPSPGGGESGWEYTYAVDLYVHVSGWLTYWANAPSRFQVFVDADEVGPAGETLWEIAKWEDIDPPVRALTEETGLSERVGDAGRDGAEPTLRDPSCGRVESITWSSIKAMYR